MEDGYYWVRYCEEWIPAEYIGNYLPGWYLTGNDYTVDVDEVGERLEYTEKREKVNG